MRTHYAGDILQSVPVITRCSESTTSNRFISEVCYSPGVAVFGIHDIEPSYMRGLL